MLPLAAGIYSIISLNIEFFIVRNIGYPPLKPTLNTVITVVILVYFMNSEILYWYLSKCLL